MTAFNAIANGGDLIQPHVVKEISHVNENGTRVIDETIEPTIKKDLLSDENTAILRGYLERTATQDGPPGSFVQGYNVGGKTGTAQKVDYENGGYSADKYIASMVALAPVDNPKITVFIAVDEPSTGVYYGGQVATPLMKELFAEIFKYMDSPLAQARYSIAKDIIIQKIRCKTVAEAEEILKANNLSFDLEGKSEYITSVEPCPGTTVKEGEKIKIYADKRSKLEKDIVMPDLRGSSLEFAKSILDNLEITYEYIGDGDVALQSIPSGTMISKGTKVSLTLKTESEY
jgi:stage V sporulation protein D (sporulation-specific penicillin-binding protein)